MPLFGTQSQPAPHGNTAQSDKKQKDATDLAKFRRDKGIANAEVGANSAIPDWTEMAVAKIAEYASSHEEFLTEDIRASLGDDFPLPPDSRAWGPATRAAITQQIIRKEGYALARSSNMSPKPLWKSLIYSGPAKCS